MLTRVPLTSGARDVVVPPSVPHLAADLTLRVSAHHPSARLLDAFMACIIRSSCYNNNNNNKITYLAPISSENPSSVAQQKGLGILVTMYKAKSRQPTDVGAKKLRRIGNFDKIGFQITAK